MELTNLDLQIKAIKEKQKAEAEKLKAQQKRDREKLKALQKKKREAEKAQEEKLKSELIKKIIGNNFSDFEKILKSNPESIFEIYINGKPFTEHLKESN